MAQLFKLAATLLLAAFATIESRDLPQLQKAEVADLCFLVDITGSMQPYIDGVRDAIRKIVADSASQINELRIGFVGYRDVGDNPNIVVRDFDTNVGGFKRFLSGLRATGGADTPEDVFGGLERVTTLNWNPQAGTKVLFHIADSPCHGRKYHNLGGDTYPDGDPENRDVCRLFGKLSRKFVNFNFGKILSRTDKMIRVFQQDCEIDISTFKIQHQTISPPWPCRPILPVLTERSRPGGGLRELSGRRGGPAVIRHPRPPCILPLKGAGGGASAGGRIRTAVSSALSRSVLEARSRLGTS